ncbi:MAG: hypothetical protein J7L28_01460 [Thermotogae bacterium]|nr:hypothetical protein [Thermotogota bacterium]
MNSKKKIPDPITPFLKKVMTKIPLIFTLLIFVLFLPGVLHVEDGFQHARDVHINLSVVTATMAGITIEVGIDYAIHYSTLFRYHEKMKSDEPHVRAFEDTSKPIIANILGLALGLTVMNLSPLMIHTYLSLIMWTTMLASSSLSLTILPYLLSKISSSKNR